MCSMPEPGKAGTLMSSVSMLDSADPIKCAGSAQRSTTFPAGNNKWRSMPKCKALKVGNPQNYVGTHPDGESIGFNHQMDSTVQEDITQAF